MSEVPKIKAVKNKDYQQKISASFLCSRNKFYQALYVVKAALTICGFF